jgi:hypothetical protein
MKGFELKDFSESLRQGLRRFPNSVNTKGLVECFNLAPSPEGLEMHDPLIDLRSEYVFGEFYYLQEVDTDDVLLVDGYVIYSPTPYN